MALGMTLMALLGMTLMLPACAGTPKSGGTIQEAIAADRRGDHAEAMRIFTLHAEQGDDVAAQTVAMKYYNGEGVAQDYCIAMDWFLKALEKNNADALNALGVMHRDGRCAPVNRKIAYDVFLTIHMQGLGSEATQMRANKNLRREVAELSPQEIQEALCYTGAYMLKYLIAKGRLDGVPREVLPSEKYRRLKDLGWWLENEKKGLEYTCPAPWEP